MPEKNNNQGRIQNLGVGVGLNWTFVASSNISSNPFEPKFTIVIFIHYKPRNANAILDL